MSENNNNKVIGGTLAAVVAAAVAFIAPWESYGAKPNLKPYRDVVGVWTVCFGETAVKMKTYTPAQCNEFLQRGSTNRLLQLTQCIQKPLTVDQYTAVLSLSYNAGVQAVCNSTLVKKINAGEPAEVWCLQLLRWDHSKGRKIKGLSNRRAAELELCLKAK